MFSFRWLSATKTQFFSRLARSVGKTNRHARRRAAGQLWSGVTSTPIEVQLLESRRLLSADILVMTAQPPTSIAAGATFGLTVTAENSTSHAVDASFTGAISVGDIDGSNIVGMTTVNATAGVAKFTGLTITSAGAHFLEASTFTQLTVDANAVTQVNPAATSQAVISGPALVLLNGTFSATVQLEDAYGNPTTDTGNVTLSLGTNPSGATLGGTLTVAAVNGAATFTGLSLNKVGSGYTLKAIKSGLPTSTGSAFAVADQVVVSTQPPATVAAGSTFGLTAKVEDANGVIQTTYNGPVTVFDSNNSGSLGGVQTVNAVSGVAKFTNLKLTLATSQIQLSVTGNGLPSSPTSMIAVTPTTATALSFDTFPQGIQNSLLSVTVRVVDAFGNLAISYSGNVTLSVAVPVANTTLTGTLTVAAAQGVATFSNLKVSQVSSLELKATSGTLVTYSPSPLSIIDRLVVTTQPPATVAAGTPFGLTAKVEDGNGVVQTSFNGPVVISSGLPLSGTTTVNAINGVVSFSGLTLTQSGQTTFTLYGLTTYNLNTSTNSTVVTPLAATKLAVLAPTGVVVNGQFSVSAQVEDSYGNTIPAYNGYVQLQLSSNTAGSTLGGTLSVKAANGVATFTGLTLNKMGSGYRLTATATGLSLGTTGTFNAEYQIVAMTNSPLSVTAGSAFGFTLAVEDAIGNLQTGYNGPISISAGYNAVLNGVLTATAIHGVATFSGLSLTLAGDTNLMATGNGIDSNPVGTITVLAAPATNLSFTTFYTYQDFVANSANSTTVFVDDAYGNQVTGYNGNITLSIGKNPGGATLGGTVTAFAQGGSATFYGLTLNKIGTGYTLVASASGLTSESSQAFNIVDNAIVTTQPPMVVTAGATFGLSVSIEDALGVVQTSFNGPVTLFIYALFAPSQTIATVNAVNGVATFTNVSLTQAQNSTLQIQAPGLGNGFSSTRDILVTPNIAKTLQINHPRQGVVPGATFTETVNVVDAYGNVQPSFSGNVTLALANNPTNATLTGTLTVAAVNGVATFTNLKISKAGLGLTLTATGTGLTSGTSTPFNVGYQLTVKTQPPSTIVAGTAFGLVIDVIDGSGVVQSTYNGDVTISSYISNAPLAGNLTVKAVNGVATFTGLKIFRASGYFAIGVTANGLNSTYTANFNVVAGAATQIVLSPPSGDVLTNAPFDYTAQAEDAYGNVDANFNGAVTLSLANNPAAATLGGTLVAYADSGLATFTAVTVSAAGSGYTLQATSPSMVTGISPAFNVTSLQLVITSQPQYTVTAGQAFGLVVRIENAAGVVQTSFNSSVTISAVTYSYAGGPTSSNVPLTGMVTVNAIHGVATFSGLSLKQSQDIQLIVSGANLGPATSTNLFVEPAAATHLVANAPAQNVLPLSPFSFTVDAEDAYGNIDYNYSGTVTLSLGANPAGATLGGTLTIPLNYGEATLTDLTLSKAGVGETLKVTSNSFTATSSAFDVVTNLAVVTTPPSSTITAGATFGLTVSIENSTGVVQSTATGTVTISATDADTGAAVTLSGTLTATVVKGVATFSGLKLVKAQNVLLTISESDVGSGWVETTVVAAAASQIVLSVPASSVLANSPFVITATVMDAFGNIVPTYTGTATLSVATNPGTGTIGGAVTATIVNGVATFSGVTISKVGVGYKLKATVGTLTVVLSPAFNIT